MNERRLESACRVALAAQVHDLGKFAQRADIPVDQQIKDIHQQLYCPRRYINQKEYWTHIHAAYTALAFDVIAQSAPELVKGDMAPFAGSLAADVTDSLVNAAASHHKPETFLQWIITTADHVSSGFEREDLDRYNQEKEPENFYCARLRSILEQITLSKKDVIGKNAYSLTQLTPQSLFPLPDSEVVPDNNEKAKAEYKKLWDAFCKAISPQSSESIPRAHRKSWSLWLDHFDTAWLTYTRNIPSATFGVVPDVSLYDHSKSTAALAVALWRWHEDNNQTGQEAVSALANREDWDTDKFLLVQGDFFGIQSFIFSQGSRTNKASAKLLRGRSFYVSLIAELAALKVLEALELPSTSQIINAAGKFLILAPNTSDTIEKLKKVQKEMDEWFLSNTLGVGGLGLAWLSASCNDFVLKTKERNFSVLLDKLFSVLDIEKFKRFNLLGAASAILDVEYPNGVSDLDERLPRESLIPEDQILIGQRLVKDERILILSSDEVLRNHNVTRLKQPIFGYIVAFTEEENVSGKFGELTANGHLRRCWDYSMPEEMDQVLWNGYARRNINGYVARFEYKGQHEDKKYASVSDEYDADSLIKTFGHLACEDHSEDGTGQIALAALKGDIDNLGRIFQEGLVSPDKKRYLNFAKMASLSRQVNEFFTIYLPVLCSMEYPNTYTVFAGGDDFFLIGPWYQIQKLAGELNRKFSAFAVNDEVHFSSGIVIIKPGTPVRAIAEMAEDALSQAKSKSEEKNAVTAYGISVSWNIWHELTKLEDLFEVNKLRFDLSTGYLYSLFNILDLSAQTDRPESSIWRSQLYYKTARINKQNNSSDQSYLMDEFLLELVNNIEKHKEALRIPLSNFFYKLRKTSR